MGGPRGEVGWRRELCAAHQASCSGSGPTPGSVLLSQPSSTLPGSVTTGSGALWDLATGCLPHSCLSGHDPGALPSCPHLNLSGKPSWLSSGPAQASGAASESPSLPIASCPGLVCEAVWKHSLWITIWKESFSERGKRKPRKVAREDGVSLDCAHVWPAWNSSCWGLCPLWDGGVGWFLELRAGGFSESPGVSVVTSASLLHRCRRTPPPSRQAWSPTSTSSSPSGTQDW